MFVVLHWRRWPHVIVSTHLKYQTENSTEPDKKQRPQSDCDADQHSRSSSGTPGQWEQMGSGSRHPFLRWQITESCAGRVQKPTCVSVLIECRTQGAICRASVSRCNTCSEFLRRRKCWLSSNRDVAPGGGISEQAGLRSVPWKRFKTSLTRTLIIFQSPSGWLLLHHRNFPMNEMSYLSLCSYSTFNIVDACHVAEKSTVWHLSSWRFFHIPNRSLDTGGSFRKSNSLLTDNCLQLELL